MLWAMLLEYLHMKHETAWNAQGNPCVWMLHPWPRYSNRVQTAQAFLLTEFRQFRPCLHAQIQAYMRPWRILTVNTELSIVSSRSAAGQDLYRVIQEVCSYRVSQREHYWRWQRTMSVDPNSDNVVQCVKAKTVQWFLRDETDEQCGQKRREKKSRNLLEYFIFKNKISDLWTSNWNIVIEWTVGWSVEFFFDRTE